MQGELTVTLKRGKSLPVWGFPWQSNPYCRLELGSQAVQSKRDDDTGQDGTHRNPVWNQEFQFLVEDPRTQELLISVRDSHYTGACHPCTVFRSSVLPGRRERVASANWHVTLWPRRS